MDVHHLRKKFLRNNMKFLVLFVLAAFACAVKSDADMLMKIVQDCKTKVGATDEDVGQIKIHAPPSNKEQKCMFSCMMNTFGMVRWFCHNFQRSTNSCLTD